MKQTKTTCTALAAGIFATGLVTSTLHGQTSDPALNALVKKGILTEQEAKQALADLDKEKASPTPPRFPFALPAGKELKLAVGGFIQAQGEFGDVGSFQGNFADNPLGVSTHKPLHDRFLLRRARLNVSGLFLEHFDFKMEGDFSNGDGIPDNRTAFSATDIFINYNQFPEANVKVGQYKAPFGLEQLTPDTSMYTIERSQVTSALTPERQIGVQLWGKPLARLVPAQQNLVEYYFGIFNGNGRNTTINDDGRFMKAGRLVLTPFAGKLWDQDVRWRLGVDGFVSDFAPGTRISPTGNLRLSGVDGSLSSFTLPTTGAGVSAEGRGWGVDQWLTFGPFDLIAEYLQANIRPTAGSTFVGFTPNGEQFTANGYYVQGSYFFPGKKFQLVAKWESFDPAQAPNDSIQSITGGLNYYILGDNLKLMFNYIHTWSDFREDNPGTGRQSFDMGIVRMQAMF